MGVREILQTELWSSRTTNKIAVSVLVLVLLAGGTEFLLEHWLNPWELQALRAVSENAKSVRTASKEDIEQKVGVAKASAAVAEKRAWTLRDHVGASLADGVIFEARMCRRYEINPVAMTPANSQDKGRNEEVRERIGKSMCSSYEVSQQYFRETLNTKLGF